MLLLLSLLLLLMLLLLQHDDLRDLRRVSRNAKDHFTQTAHCKVDTRLHCGDCHKFVRPNEERPETYPNHTNMHRCVGGKTARRLPSRTQPCHLPRAFGARNSMGKTPLAIKNRAPPPCLHPQAWCFNKMRSHLHLCPSATTHTDRRFGRDLRRYVEQSPQLDRRSKLEYIACC